MYAAVQNINGFLNSAPLWMKWATLLWFFLTFFLILASVYITLFGIHDPIVGGKSTSLSSVNSHYEAAHYDSYLLGCKKSAAPSNVSTIELRLCNAISEARRHLKSLVVTRNYLLVNPRKWESPEVVSTFNITNYIATDFRVVDQGLEPEKLGVWLQRVTRSLETLQRVVSLSEYEKWLVSTNMTIDDLIFAFGFVEWVLAYEAKEELTPSELYKLGPFMSEPFTKDEYLRSALKYFVSFDGSALSYIDVVGEID